mgnify:CR=1 FL=1
MSPTFTYEFTVNNNTFATLDNGRTPFVGISITGEDNDNRGVRSSTTPSKLIDPTVHYGYEITFDTNIDEITVLAEKENIKNIAAQLLILQETLD